MTDTTAGLASLTTAAMDGRLSGALEEGDGSVHDGSIYSLSGWGEVDVGVVAEGSMTTHPESSIRMNAAPAKNVLAITYLLLMT